MLKRSCNATVTRVNKKSGERTPVDYFALSCKELQADDKDRGGKLALTETDVFIDFGQGMWLMMTYPGAIVAGIDDHLRKVELDEAKELIRRSWDGR